MRGVGGGWINIVDSGGREVFLVIGVEVFLFRLKEEALIAYSVWLQVNFVANDVFEH